MSNSHRLEAIEYVCWLGSVVGSVVAALSGQLLYALAPLCLSLWLNLFNRQRLILLSHRQTMGAIARVQQQLDQDIENLQQQIQTHPLVAAPKLDLNRTPISSMGTTSSQVRLSQLEDLQLVYQEIVQLQERYSSLRDSLVNVIDYLNTSPLPARVNALEQEISRLYNQLGTVQQQLNTAATLPPEPRVNPVPPPTHPPSTQDAENPLLEDRPLPTSSLHLPQALSFPLKTDPPIPRPSTAPSFTLSANQDDGDQDDGEPVSTDPSEGKTAQAPPPSPETPPVSPVILPSFGAVPQPQNWERVATLSDHSDWVSDLAIVPDGKTLVSSSFDKTIQLWNLETKATICVLAEHTSPVCAIALSPNGRFLASCSWDKTIKLWDLEKQKLVNTLTEETEAGGSVRSVAISPNGKILASGWFDQTVKLWKLKIGKRVTASFLGSYTGHLGRVDAIAFSPDSETLASGSADGTIKTWQLNTTGKPLQDLTQILAETPDPVTAIAYSPDGQFLASSSRDRTIQLWNLATGERSHQLSGHSGAVMSVAFYPDGEMLASASTDGTLGLWHLGSGTLVQTLTGETGSIVSVTLSPDGQTLVSGSVEGTIEIWRQI